MKTKKSNSLAIVMPDLAKEWHPTKNGDLLPTDVTCYSEQKVWWLLPYTDPETGKYFEFEWKCSVHNRTIGSGCPFISGQRVWSGFNDLATKRPDIAAEWHPIKNGTLTPRDVTERSGQNVWWLLSYDDPITEKHFDFEWKNVISNRTGPRGDGCPYLSGKAVHKGFNDLATLRPNLAKEWHPTKNGKLTPENVPLHYGKRVWWCLPYDDPVTGHHDFEWQATVDSRVGRNLGCPYLSNKDVWVGYNDLETTHPDIAQKFHPIKNGTLTPKDFTYGSGKVVWWLYRHYDEMSGKWIDFEWKACVRDVVRSRGECPHLSGKLVCIGFNDLATTNPHLAAEWHPTKNGQLKPTDVTAGSNKRVWWFLPYNDPQTGKNFEFEWEAVISTRSSGVGCPFLSGKEIYQGFNDLKSKRPDLASEWHPTKNGNLTPEKVTIACGKRVWWYLPYDDPNTGKHFDFEWEQTIDARTLRGAGCPYLSNQKILLGFNDLATTHPNLAKEWHPTKNKNLNPTQVTAGYNKVVWWMLPYDDPKTGKHFDFEWQSSVSNRTSQNLKCPYLSNQRLWKGFNDLASVNPELAKEWHPTKNGDLTPSDVMPGSSRKVWWKKFILGKEREWLASINYRHIGGLGCPGVKFSSMMESNAAAIFERHNIKYNCQIKFGNCRSPRNGQLSYDFGGDNLSWLIECDGIQHFQFSDFFFKNETEFKMRVQDDNNKTQYAVEHKIPLLRIPYIYANKLDKVELFILEFVKTKNIPQEILDFYSQFELSNYVQCVKAFEQV